MRQSQKFYSKLLMLSALILPLLFASTLVIAAEKHDFSDLKEEESGYEDVMKLVNEGIITGYSDGTFKPYNNISREHVAVILSRALDLEKPDNLEEVISSYQDINADYIYASEIAAVIKAGIFKGVGKLFQPETTITRAQMATVLVRAFELQPNRTPVDLVDLPKINVPHKENVRIFAQNGITVGKQNAAGEYCFDGNGKLKRIQFSSFLNRTLEVANKVEKPEEKKEMLWSRDLNDVFSPDMSWSPDDSMFVIKNTVYDGKTGKAIKKLNGNRAIFCKDGNVTSIIENGEMNVYDRRKTLS